MNNIHITCNLIRNAHFGTLTQVYWIRVLEEAPSTLHLTCPSSPPGWVRCTGKPDYGRLKSSPGARVILATFSLSTALNQEEKKRKKEVRERGTAWQPDAAASAQMVKETDTLSTKVSGLYFVKLTSSSGLGWGAGEGDLICSIWWFSWCACSHHVKFGANKVHVAEYVVEKNALSGLSH